MRPGQVSAGIGNLRCVAFTGLHEGRHWVQMEILEGSYGGREGMDGMDAVDTLYANTRNNPIEDIESHLPLRVSRYELRDQAPHRTMARRHRLHPRVRFLADGCVLGRGRGPQISPLGVRWRRGRGPPRPCCGRAAARQMPSKVPYRGASTGDRWSPADRRRGLRQSARKGPDAVPGDMLDGLIVRQAAEADYGVVIEGRPLDVAATRASARARRGRGGLRRGEDRRCAHIVNAPGVKDNLRVGDERRTQFRGRGKC